MCGKSYQVEGERMYLALKCGVDFTGGIPPPPHGQIHRPRLDTRDGQGSGLHVTAACQTFSSFCSGNSLWDHLPGWSHIVEFEYLAEFEFIFETALEQDSGRT